MIGIIQSPALNTMECVCNYTSLMVCIAYMYAHLHKNDISIDAVHVAQNTIGNYDYIHTAYMHAHVTHTHTSSVFAYERYRPQSVILLVVYHDNVSRACMLNPCS